jgi:universal stress protein A
VLVGNGFRVPPDQVYIRAGEPATEIKRLAHQLQADLVIVGSHNRSGGWLSLPGATTNCVLQGIQSDVMAVRV